MVPSAMDIHVEARWRDGDMQGGDTLACACLLDLPPLPRGMEFRCFLAGIYARVNPKATSRDRSGRGGRQVWFLSKRGGSLATLGTTPAHPYLLSDLNEGTTNREMASPQSQTEQDNHSKPLCVASMSTKMAHTSIIS